MPNQWYYIKDGQQQGPVAAERLKELASSGQLLEDDLVWQDGIVDWVAAKSIKGLFPVSPPTLAASSPGSTSPLAVVTHEPTANKSFPEQSAVPTTSSLNPTKINKHPMTRVIGGVLLLFLLVSVIVRGCGLMSGHVARKDKGKQDGNSAASVQDAKWGFLDTTGKVSIDFQFDDVRSFSQGLAAAQKGSKWGYIDTNGKAVIDFQFDTAENFSEGAAFVTKPNERLCIDAKGKTLFTHQFDHCEPFSDGVAVVRMGKPDKGANCGKGVTYGVIDKAGRTIVAPTYSFIYRFVNGVAVVCVGDELTRYGAIDTSGKHIVKPIYYMVSAFYDGAAIVVMGENVNEAPTAFGIVDTTGHFTMPLQQAMRIMPYVADDDAWRFSDGLTPFARPSGTTFGYLDASGRIVISPEQTEAGGTVRRFSEGLASAGYAFRNLSSDYDEAMKQSAKLNKFGYIDKSGMWAIEPQFDVAENFSGGLAAVRRAQNDKCGFIDRSGKSVISPRFDAAGSFADGIAWVKVGDRYGFINPKGEEVIPLQYAEDQFKHFEGPLGTSRGCVCSEGLVPVKLRPQEAAKLRTPPLAGLKAAELTWWQRVARHPRPMRRRSLPQARVVPCQALLGA